MRTWNVDECDALGFSSPANHIHVQAAERLWGLVGLVVLFSIVLHGLTVTPIMRLLERQHGRDPDKDEPPAVGA